MRLRAGRRLTVTFTELDLRVEFAAGEDLRTEVSAKFRRESVESELVAATFAPYSWWTDHADRFAASPARAL
ncbi:MAG: L-histidine N(alpha)-methyltransferase [Haloechinothrix sp.]